jgi:hypothetical protein
MKPQFGRRASSTAGAAERMRLSCCSPSAEVVMQLRRRQETARPTNEIVLMSFSNCPSGAHPTTHAARLLPESTPAPLLRPGRKDPFCLPAAVEIVLTLSHIESDRHAVLFAALRLAALVVRSAGASSF